MSSLAEEIKLRRAAKSETKQSCYSIKEGVSGVRIKDGNGKNWIMPWIHHLFSSREDDGGERLLLTFAIHEVSITGYNLEALEEEIALNRLEKLRHMPGHYIPARGQETVVTEIEVKPRDEDGRKAKAEDSISVNE